MYSFLYTLFCNHVLEMKNEVIEKCIFKACGLFSGDLYESGHVICLVVRLEFYWNSLFIKL